MVALALACLPIFFTGHLINRAEGALFLVYYAAYTYAAYTVFLVLAATQHDALPLLSDAMIAFVVPLTIVTLVIVAARAARPAAAD